MNIFVDTSSLFKLYHQETDTELIDQIFSSNKISRVFLSEITKVEFSSTIWKKVRMNEMTEEQASKGLVLFEADIPKYTFIPIDDFLINKAQKLISKYGKHGLRTLDSIQFATALSLVEHCTLFVSSDKILSDLFRIESLPVSIS